MTTPGTVGATPFLGDGALDFLGLDDELMGATDEPAPATPAHAAPTGAAGLVAEPPWEDQGEEIEAVEISDALSDALDFEQPFEEAYEEAHEQPYDESDEASYDETSAPEAYDENPDEEDVHAAWREEEQPARGRSKVLALAAGMSVIGMLAVAGVKLVSATQGAKDVPPEPLAAHTNPLPRAETVVTPDAPGLGAAEPTRLVLDSEGGATPTAVRSTFEAPPPDPVELAREQFDQSRGDTGSSGYDPFLGSAPPPAQLEPEPASEPTWTAPGSGATSQAVEPLTLPEELAAVEPAAVEPEPTLVEATTGPTATTEPALPEPASTEAPSTELAVAPAALEPETGELVAASSQPAALELAPEPVAVEPVTAEGVGELIAVAPTQEPTPSTSEPGQGTPQPQRPWLTAAMLRAVPTPDPALQAPPPPPELLAGWQASASTEASLTVLGPLPAPTQVQPTQVAPTQVASTQATGETTTDGTTSNGTSAVASLLDGRDPKASAAAAQPAPTGVESEAPSLRQADSSDMATIWEGAAIPQDKLGAKVKILTPNIGRVRIVLKSGDIFEGRMYAVGEGSAWIDTKYGRMALAGERIASMANLDTKDGTPVLGATGSQDLAGMERVRIKTPGGVLYGKVVARDDKRTTVMTDEGARLTLDNTQVELLVDAPKVVIKGTVPENERPPKKP